MTALTRIGLCCIGAALTGNLLATDYYVSNSGNDHKDGSLSRPWQTIARVNKGTYKPGDRIFFQGGETFSGNLYFSSTSSGTAANPIVISSYPSGTATIMAGTRTGLYAYNTAGFSISNLHFVGSGGSSNGIMFYADLAGGVKLDTVKIDQVEVNNFGQDGVVVGSWSGSTGYQNVSITNTKSHDNSDGGIIMFGYTPVTGNFPHQNIYIGHSQTYNNPGIPTMTAHSSGNGICLGQVQNATIERSVSYNNGANNTASAGPVGIWTYDSDMVTIQHNESHHNHNNSFTDGDGFDLDGGVSNSVLQYNYSHDNDGAGFLICGYSGARVNNNNIVRYNISQNDARKNSLGAIYFWTAYSGLLQNAQIYNNTVFLTQNPYGTASAINFQTAVANVAVRNNIFMVSGNVPLVQAAAGQNNVVFQGNDYWAAGGAAFSISWAGGSYSDLASWRATGQEMLNGTPVGMSLDPKLTSPGGGGTINDSDLLNTLSAYRLLTGSPLIDTGLNLPSRFGLNVGTSDFYGNPIPHLAGYDVGAAEY